MVGIKYIFCLMSIRVISKTNFNKYHNVLYLSSQEVIFHIQIAMLARELSILISNLKLHSGSSRRGDLEAD